MQRVHRGAGAGGAIGRRFLVLGAAAVEAGVHRGPGLVRHHLVGGQRCRVGGEAVEPLRHHVERQRGQRIAGARADPDHLVVDAAVGALQPCAHHQVALVRMDVARGVVVGARMQDRHEGQAAAARVDQAARIGALERKRIAHGALRHRLAVLVVAADLLVERHELLGTDRALVEGLEPVLHADVVERAAREAGDRVAAHDVGAHVGGGAARAGRVVDRVVDLRDVLEGAAGRVGRDDGVDEAQVPGAAGAVGEAVDRRALGIGPGRGVGLVDVLQQAAVGHVQAAVGEGQRGLQAVEQARVDLRDHQLLDRAARTARAGRPARHAVGLDEALLQHHQRLALQHRVAALAVHQLGRDHVGEAARQVQVAQRIGGLVHALVVLRARAAAEAHHQPAVPARGGLVAGGHHGLGRGVVEQRDAVDRAAHRARVHAHDVGHRLALDGCGLRQVGRARERIGQRFEAAGRRAIEVVVAPRCRAVRIERRAHVRFDRAAFVGREQRTREDRAGVGMVGEHQFGIRGRAALGAGLHRQRVRAHGQALDHAAQVAVRIARELGRHRLAVQREFQPRGRRARGRLHLDQRIAAAHELRLGRQHRDRGLVERRRRRGRRRGRHDGDEAPAAAAAIAAAGGQQRRAGDTEGKDACRPRKRRRGSGRTERLSHGVLLSWDG